MRRSSTTHALEIIPVETWLASEKIIKEIDVDDIDFVALMKFLKATLWTGDKVLYKASAVACYAVRPFLLTSRDKNAIFIRIKMQYET